MSILTIAAVNVRRMLRDRSNIFFVFIFPLLVVVLLGVQYGQGFTQRVGVLVEEPEALARELATGLEGLEGVRVDRYQESATMREDVSRGRLQGGVVVPAGYDERLRAGQQVTVSYLTRPDPEARSLADVVRAVIAERAMLVTAARIAVEEGAGSFEDAYALAQAARGIVPGVDVEVASIGTAVPGADGAPGPFDLGASQQLLLFTFLTTLAGSSALIEVRRLGITRRMLATPTSVRRILAGETLGRFGVALVQAGYIVVGTRLLFGVGWGDPLGAAVIVVLFSLLSAGAAMLMGSILRNDSQAGGVGVLVGLATAALGGSMVPLEVMSPTLRRVAHATPHAWAMDAFGQLVRRGGSVVDVLDEAAVLAGFAAALLAVAIRRLRRSLVG